MDELPQFWNVLIGNMSVVGPRPHPTQLNLESMETVDNYMLRHKVIPGITGLAQVNGCRGETKTTEDMQRRVNFDLYYIQRWNFWLDLQIIIQTVINIFRGDQNAY
jgi:putative colanic acid biosynthesis UDP-glucose lipid carrier transferase